MKFGLLGAAGIFLLMGCGDPTLDRNLLPEPSSSPCMPTHDFPGVVRVYGKGVKPDATDGICMGSIVSTNAVLTASHCVFPQASKNRIQHVTGGIERAERVIRFGPGDQNDPNDLALLIFENIVDDPAKEVLRIGAQVALGDEVRLVGFEREVMVTGTNLVYRFAAGFFETMTPLSRFDKITLGPINRAATRNGDSGGPILKAFGTGWRIVGVTHAGYSEDNDQLSVFTNLTRPENAHFLTANGIGID